MERPHARPEPHGERHGDGEGGLSRVPAHLTGKPLLPLWRAVHERLSSGRPVRSVTLRDLDEEAQAALADLLGSSSYPGSRVIVRLDRLDAALAPLGLDGRAVASAAVGPIGNRAAERERHARERTGLWSWLSAHPVVVRQPALVEWVDRLRADGVPREGAARLRERCERALAVLEVLPLSESLPLPTLAAREVGDPHALDDTAALPSLVLRALATLRGLPVPGNAQDRRALWGAFGVDCDSHSTSVLALGLRPVGDGPLATTLRVWADAGHAVSITLDQLSGNDDVRQPFPVVHVVENPSVLALAQRRLGTEAPPLVCVSGWPNSAAVALLRRLGEDGARVRYHGDFDGEGLRIAAHVMARTGAVPWRMGASDYLGALREAGAVGPEPGRMSPSPWDAELSDLIGEQGVAVPEERVADLLVDDLAAVTRG
ncbi:TIGR02679 family protein [Nocardiopsis sp. JB363]|uniref:TIGR02679 family protein n=1 Tax=Nocardiopsis sp. JB363 TaxID=1434837 RepID=UPI001F364AD2|nr:TIGR02679 family protein [Nocardiopsis sp. JB363]